MKTDIFDHEDDDLCIVSFGELKYLYARVWNNGSNDDCGEEESDTEIECRLVEVVE